MHIQMIHNGLQNKEFTYWHKQWSRFNNHII